MSKYSFNADVEISGNLKVSGKSTVSVLEEVVTPENILHLREGAQTGLIAGEYTGIVAEKYDGENTGMLVFDFDGTAWVGDEGDLQPLLTRSEESKLPEGTILKWNSNTKRAEASEFTEGEVREIYENYLPKVTEETAYPQAYSKSPEGDQTRFNIANGAIAETIMFRDDAGRAKIGSPAKDYDIANKIYVDNLVYIDETQLNLMLQEVLI